MGADKADLLFGDQTFLQYQIEKGRMLGIQEIIISGYHGTKGCEAQIVKDRYPGLWAAWRTGISPSGVI